MSYVASWNGQKPSFLCGHQGAKSVSLVQYSSSESGVLHLMCSTCIREGKHFAQLVSVVKNMKTGEVYS